MKPWSINAASIYALYLLLVFGQGAVLSLRSAMCQTNTKHLRRTRCPVSYSSLAEHSLTSPHFQSVRWAAHSSQFQRTASLRDWHKNKCPWVYPCYGGLVLQEKVLFPLLPYRVQPLLAEHIWICRWVGHGLATSWMYCSPRDTPTSTYMLWGLWLFLVVTGGQSRIV